MKDDYLKHLTVAVVGICATIIAVATPDHTGEVLIILATIAGYTLKNGYKVIQK